MDTTHERLNVPVGGQTMGAYLARPADGGSYPGIVLFMEVFGVNAHIRSVADRVAGEGYVVLAPDIFHRTAPGVELEYDEAGIAKGIDLMNRVTATELLADTRAAMQALERRDDVGGRGLGVMGFCFGGHAAYLAACELPVAAAVSFNGGGVALGAPGGEQPPTVQRTAGIRGSILCLFGDNDGYISVDQIETVKRALSEAGVDHEVVVYSGAGHGFFCDARSDYKKEAAADAWRRVTGFFAQHIG